MPQRVKLVIAYLGTGFRGWQRQPRQRTVQGELEAALARLLGCEAVPVVGAGRTDAGVHAAGQVAHADLPGTLPLGALLRGVNALLPDEIRVRSATVAAPGFHARSNAVAKTYIYRARWHTGSLPWSRLRAAEMPRVDEPAALTALTNGLEGRHDWASFTVTDPATATTVRTIHRVRVRPRRGGFDLEFLGEGFLRYQVRRMVGALLEVAGGRRDPDWLLDLVARPRPGARIATAPAKGLTLEHVFYRRTPAMRPAPD